MVQLDEVKIISILESKSAVGELMALQRKISDEKFFEGCRFLGIDISGLEIVNSIILSFVVKLYKQAKERGIELGLVVSSVSIRKTISNSGLVKYIPLYSTAEEIIRLSR
ncbi:MAG: STAS domain-containing protein [Fibrobacterota bacterium]